MRRILTAVLLIPLVIALVLWGPPYLLVSVQLLITWTGLWEFFRLAELGAGAKPLSIPGYAFATTVALCALSESLPVGIVAATIFFLMLLLAVAMLGGREIAGYLKSVAATFFGVIYVAVPLSLLVWVCLQQDGPYWTLFALVVIWVSDTAAFFVGRAFGKHMSSPRISPNKTWEGTCASFAAALLVGLLGGLLYALFFWEGSRFGELVFLAACLNVAGQLGDLAESALKRCAGVKDSSHLIPGHGGVLDRIDAVLFAAPVLWYYWLWRLS
ncbi:MAG: phosphatidate cytidylyltransferase [Acidobacteria bacterium]|nr:phosphatidate cytidylyltransferase [Acidobacteriota bacterium]